MKFIRSWLRKKSIPAAAHRAPQTVVCSAAENKGFCGRGLSKAEEALCSISNLPDNIRNAFLVGLRNADGADPDELVEWHGNSLRANEWRTAIEFILPWKFLLPRPPGRCSYDIMGDFSCNLVDCIRSQGRLVIPIVNFGNWQNLPPKRTSHRISWHSRGTDDKHLHLKIGTLPDFVSIDSRGFSGWSAFSELKDFTSFDPEECSRHVAALAASILKTKQSKYSQPQQGFEPVAGDCVFLAMQTVDDVVSLLADIPTLQLLKDLALLSEELSLQVLVKRHPLCTDPDVSDAICQLGKMGTLKFVDGNIHDLIAGARKVVTVNSGVGAEALLHRKQVITSGRSDYGYATVRVSTFAELRSALTSESDIALNRDLDQFLFAYTTQYMVHTSDIERLNNHGVLRSFVAT